MTRKSLIRGAAILAAAGLANRFLGAVSRIVLPSLIGDEGVGLYQMAYPVYGVFLVVSTAGVPVAVSKLVAEQTARNNPAGALKVLKVATAILFLTGTFFSAALALGAGPIARYVARDARAALAIVAVSPAVLILSVTSAFRGYFQGMQEMGPSALSQVSEQVVRVSAMIGLAWLLLPRGVEFSAAGANLGAVLGGAAGFLVLLVAYFRLQHVPGSWKVSWAQVRAVFARSGREGGGARRRGDGESRGRSAAEDGAPGGGARAIEDYMGSTLALVRRIFDLSLPVVLAAAIMPLMQFLDIAIVPMRLASAGFSPDEVTRLFGRLTGMAQPLMYFPTLVTSAVAASAVPAISEALARRDRSTLSARAEEAIRLGFLFALPSAVGLFVFAKEFSIMLRWPAEVAVPLRALAFGTVFLALQQVSSGILQGLGEVTVPVRNLAKGALAKLVVSLVLTGMPAYGIRGAAYGTVAAFAVAGLLNVAALVRMLGLSIDVMNTAVKPVLGVAVMALVARAAYAGVYRAVASNTLGALAAIVVAVAVYGLALLVTGVVGRHELEVFPGGGKIASVLERLGLLRR
ncbi:MAG TPA: polysaccharide biosynthesis protein [Firmicutes bacterium]|mgnify:CR=1 FL=1|nr:polysaccharide biosynthesis protein [Bacillota bacterium]